MKAISEKAARSQAAQTVEVWRNRCGMSQLECLEAIGAETNLGRWISWPRVINETARFIRLWYAEQARQTS